MGKKKDYHLHLTEEHMEKIRALAKIQGSSLSQLINDLSIAFLNRNEKTLEVFEEVANKINAKIIW